MISHPLSGIDTVLDRHGNFSQYQIIDAQGFSGDYPAFYEASGDFGTLGDPPLTSEDIGMGFRWTSSHPRHLWNRNQPRNTVPQIRQVKKQTSWSPYSMAFYRNKRMTIPSFSRPKMTVPQISEPRMTTPQISSPQITIPQISEPRMTTPQISPPQITIPQISTPSLSSSASIVSSAVVPSNQIIAPRQTPSEVVSTGGQITQQKINQAQRRAQQRRKRRFRLNITKENMHPLSRFSQTMGSDYQLGDHMQLGFLNLKNLWEDTKKKAQEELQKAKEKLEADLKLRVGQGISNISAQILNKPEVREVIQEKAKETVVQNVAEKLLDPEVQKKAAIGSIGILALIGGLAFLAFRKK
jgi:hypothetical protein